MKPAGLYEQVLANLGEGASLPMPKAPRSSAAVVLWRSVAGEGRQVYWVRRSLAVPFMAGWHAFPGGGLARSDVEIEIAGAPVGVEKGPADGAMPAGVLAGIELDEVVPPGLVAATLRELYEETGILPGCSVEQRPALAAARRALLAKEISFEGILERFSLSPDASDLVYAGRWLTPPLGPLRFDNRFFLLEWHAGMGEPEIVVGELDHGEWIDPAEALASWRSGEVVTAPPILHILEVMAEEGPAEGLERLRAPREANFGDYRRIEFRPGVLLFPQPTPTLPPATHTNSYLIGFGEGVLIDPGSPYEEEAERLANGLEATREVLGRSVGEIWLTHHHPDHVGGVAALQKRLSVPVRAHRATMDRLASSGIVFSEPLGDGEVVRLPSDAGELEIEVLHTPGHARGHLCFFERRQGWLIGGDMVSGVGMIVIDPPEGSMEQYLESLARLEALGATTLFPGHGPTMADPTAKFRRYREHRLWREGKILDAWREGVREPSEMLPTVYADVPPIAHPLAIRQIHAHLERLTDRGELDSTES